MADAPNLGLLKVPLRVHLDSPRYGQDTAWRRAAAGVERCGSSSNTYTHMTYIRDLERDLKALLDEGDMAKVIRFVKEKALESYRNGLDATALRVDQAAEKLERSVRAS